MKKLLFVLIMLGFLACNNKSGNRSLTGKWRPVEMNFSSMREDEKKELIENTVIEFTGDGKFFTDRKNEKREGTYTYDEKNHTLRTIMNEGKTEEFTVTWEGSNLVITSPEGSVKLKR